MIINDRFIKQLNFSKDFERIPQTASEAELCAPPDPYDTAMRQYAGFVPNHIFLHKPPADVITYAFLQFCNFFSIKLTKKIIDERLSISYGTFRNSLKNLRDKGFVKKEPEGDYLFNPLAEGNQKQWVTSKELTGLSKGYYIDVDILGDKRISNITKMVYATIKSIAKSRPKMHQAFIGSKIARERKAVNRSVKQLVKYSLITAHQTCDEANLYTIVESKKMYSESTDKKSCHQNGTPVCHQNGTLSNSSSNKYNIDNTGVRDNEVLKSLSTDKDLLKLENEINQERHHYSNLMSEISSIEQKKSGALKKLNEATLNIDIEGIRYMHTVVSNLDLSLNRLETSAKKITEKMSSNAYSIHQQIVRNNSVRITAETMKAIEDSARKVLPDFKDSKTTNAAYCMLVNSLFSSYNSYFMRRKSKNYKKKDNDDCSAKEALECVMLDLKNKRYNLSGFTDDTGKNLNNNKKSANIVYKDRFEHINA